MRVKTFSNYIKESEEIDNLARLKELGIIDEPEYRAGSHKLLKAAMASAKERGEEPISVVPTLREVAKLPEADALRARGLEIVSSPTQLANGTLVWSRPGYNRKEGWGLGFFAASRLLRRMTPKGIKLTYFRSLGSMDILIKDFSRMHIESDLDFYRIAMKWANDHIDWERLEDEYATEDPQVWRYYVKNKTKRGYFEN